ncbi:alpha-galactosidase [Aquimarina sp. U1-2]|uniref:alpha-galactosidase n=1 Tax=Aquimarina sp. U1-2 TaxID=2823141 RepID=UPI001AECDF8E|nr:alpha-galactosidase [Aquimarina sp. U1-2]MBP2833679.1 alpha-galactosidase [Aquimarina sp. U1-2]
MDIFKWILLCAFNILASLSHAQQHTLPDIHVTLKKDTLYLENGQVGFTYEWNNGNLILKKIVNKKKKQSIYFPDHNAPDIVLPGEDIAASDAKIEIIDTRLWPNEDLHKQVSIYFSLGNLEIKRIIKIYPNTSAISHTFYLRGKATASTWVLDSKNELGMIEKDHQEDVIPSVQIGNIPLNNRHWETTVVSFKEATDYHDNLVFEQNILPYRKKTNLSGTILLASNQQDDIGFFLIKEAPISNSQHNYPGYDFQIDRQSVTIHGIGIAPENVTNSWMQGYGYAIGVGSADKTTMQYNLLQYQKQLRKYIPNRDGMILSNTWGDRSKDSRMNEAFILKEIEHASKIGITHLQLDDGWQKGLSRNSASKAGQKWDDWRTEDWQPHPKRFPNGFKTIIATAKKKNIEICLWFNPSKANSYQLWERDATILIDYYQKYGIEVFKIDGMSFADKQSEINLRKLFTKVMKASKGQVTFNMDVTAGRRVGYHYFNEFGNVFLENRYTDWGNYYPHRTLRNLWQLSGYVPTERLQIEFLNPLRNPHKYPKDDILAPSKIPLSYSSAITLAAQPLAWMELSSLTNITTLEKQFTEYKKISEQLHSAIILPVGQEPSGFSWTGFVAYQKNKPAYALVFKEFTNTNTYKLKIPDLHIKVEPKRILGNEISISHDEKHPGILTLHSAKQFDYGLFRLD